MTWHKYMIAAVEELHPGASPITDFLWMQNGPDTLPEMVFWDEAKLGPINFELLQETAERLSTYVPVPKAISKAQALIVLYNHGLLEVVKDKLMNHPYIPARIWFENANEWARDNVYIQAVGAELELTEEQIDALFIEGATYI